MLIILIVIPKGFNLNNKNMNKLHNTTGVECDVGTLH